MGLSPPNPAATLTVCAAILLISCPSAQSKCKFKAIFNFGDSNSDTGGFWAAFPAQTGPYGMTFFKNPAGRASDGRLLIDFLAQALGLPFLSPYLQSLGSDYRHGANFATLASTVLLPNTSLFVTGISPFSLAIQINQMKAFKASVDELHRKPVKGSTMLPRPSILRKSLFTFNIGQNDFTSNLAAIGIDGVKHFLPQVVSQIAGSIQEVYGLGGRAFLVQNLAPIGCFPAFLEELPHVDSDVDGFGCMESYNRAVEEYNGMLREALRRSRQALPGASVIYVDTYSVFLQLFRHPGRHGLVHGTRACCGRGGGAHNFDRRVVCGKWRVIDGRNYTAEACGDPQRYVSWDGIHATEAANRAVAAAILDGSAFEPPFPLSHLCRLRSLA